MKLLISILLICLSFNIFAQDKLPIVRANSKTATVYEEGNSASRWGINPKVSLDVYTTNKFRKFKKVKFKTDIDSITFQLKAGEKKNFIVLMNGKDSCLTQIQARNLTNYSRLKPEVHDSIAFSVNQYNTNLVNIVLNETDSLTMNFDSGATEMSLTNGVLDKKLKSKPKLYNTIHQIKLGKRLYKSKIYDTQTVGHEADGLLGWDLFDGMIVELNYDKNAMIIHSKFPENVKSNPHFYKFNISYINDRPFIESKIKQNGVTNSNWFLFDLGYQRTVMLDNDLLKQNNFPVSQMEVIKKQIVRGTQNNEIPIITANLETLQIGPFALQNVPAQILTQNKPMHGINIHILGNEVLKRFHTFFDFQKDVIYLMPNQSYKMPYLDQKKS